MNKKMKDMGKTLNGMLDERFNLILAIQVLEKRLGRITIIMDD